mgnify:CR=1 FL=1
MNLQSVIGTGVAGVGGILGGYVNRAPSPYDFSLQRNIHDKSYLEFHFPDPDKLVARLPFYENIDIRENKKANIITYDPIGRSSSLYAYAGASSRSLKLSFFLTLPHILAMHKGALIRFDPGSMPKRKASIREEFLADPENQYVPIPSDPFEVEMTQLNLGIMGSENTPPLSQVLNDIEKEKFTERKGIEANEFAQNKLSQFVTSENFVKYVAWWVNLIRSSVLNNQTDLMQGPPIIRLKHGELYNNIPCICKSYDISFDNNAGMDRRSLLSRRIKVNMNLEEFRAGNFGKYDHASIQPLDRDNVAGWEAVIEYTTTDPGFGPSKGAPGPLSR